jgi:hypothetical protein
VVRRRVDAALEALGQLGQGPDGVQLGVPSKRDCRSEVVMMQNRNKSVENLRERPKHARPLTMTIRRHRMGLKQGGLGHATGEGQCPLAEPWPRGLAVQKSACVAQRAVDRASKRGAMAWRGDL